MNWEAIVAVAEIGGTIAVFITLVYLSIQIRQGNILARYQARQAMMEQDLTDLQLQITNLDIPKAFFNESPSKDERLKLHLFLTHLLRQREWEWNQYKDGIIDESVYRTYHEVIAIFLCTPKTIKWWDVVGKAGFDPDFVKDVDRLLSKREISSYWENTLKFITDTDTTTK